MKTILKISGSLLILAGLVFYGCSKSDTTTPGNNGSNPYTDPALAQDTLINLPTEIDAKASSDANLYMLTSTAGLVNVYSTSLAGAFIYDQNTIDGWKSSKNSDGSTSYKFTYLQYSVTLTYFQSSSQSWWKYSYDSASYTQPLYYIVDNNGTSGEVDWYDVPNFKDQSVLALKDSWNKSGNTTNSTLLLYDTDGVTVTDKYVSTSNTDKSGTLNIYTNISGQLVLQWNFVWDSTGSGNYTEYDTNGTSVLFTNTF